MEVGGACWEERVVVSGGEWGNIRDDGKYETIRIHYMLAWNCQRNRRKNLRITK